ncbi:MAG: ATP synthase F1 subunit delta [Pseudomonadota bacterium]
MLAKRYAKALFELAKHQGIIEQIWAEISAIEKYRQEIPRFRLLLDDVNIPLERKKNLIQTIITSFALSGLLKNFLLLLADKGLNNLFGLIVAQYLKIKAGFEKIIHVKVEVAADKYVFQARSKVEEILSRQFAQKVVCEVKVNPDLLGGIVLKVGDKVFDNSILGRLERMQKEV